VRPARFSEQEAGQSHARVTLLLRRSLYPPEWEVLDSGDINNDSACRSNYSIDWEYNDKHRAKKVVVFGDFGSAPFAGTIIYQRSLDHEAKLGGEK
jgi:hypothetical protein